MCVMAGVGLDDGRAPCPRRRGRAPRDAARPGPPRARVLPLPRRARRDQLLPAPGYKENGGVFSHTNPWIAIAETMVGNGDRAFERYLRINPSAREDLRPPPMRALRVRADDRRQGGGDARRGEELLAHGLGGVELRGDHPVDPGHPSRARRPADRSVPAGGVGRVRGHPPIPREHLPDRDRKPVGVTGRITSLLVDGRQVDGNVVAPAPEGAHVAIEGTVA